MSLTSSKQRIGKALSLVSGYLTAGLLAILMVASGAAAFAVWPKTLQSMCLALITFLAGWTSVSALKRGLRGSTAPTRFELGPSRIDPKPLSDISLEKEELRSILRWIPVGIVYFGLGRKVLYCNEAFCRMYGFTEEELIGHSPPIPEDRKQEWAMIESDLRSGKEFHNHRTVRLRKDGTFFHALISGVPLFDDRKELAGLIGVIVQSEHYPNSGVSFEHILSLAESSSDFLLLLDTSFHIVYANPGFSIATGVNDADLPGTELLGYFTDAERIAIEDDLIECLASGRNNRELTAHLCHVVDGSSIPVSLEVYPMFEMDTAQPSALACIARDLQRETTLREQIRKIATESEVLFEAPIGIVKLDTLGFPIACNSRFSEMLGYRSEELRGRPIFSLVYPKDRAKGRSQFLNLASGKIDRYQALKRLIRKDGEIVHVAVTASLIRNSSGEPDHAISVMSLICEEASR